jgi:ribonuclease Z
MRARHGMQLHVVGSGCPDAEPDRYGSAFVLEIDGQAVLIDCGPATTYKMARMGIDPLRVSHLFFTHHHFDHNVDFPCFALTRWDQSMGKEPPLEVYGPPPTEAFVEALVGENGAFTIDWKSRVNHPASHACHQMRGGVLPRPAPAIHAQDISPGLVAKTDLWTATAVCVHHVEPTMISVAYRFDTDQGSIVFAGDCADCEGLREIAAGAETLVMACTHFGSPPANPALVDVITGTPEVAAISQQAGVRRVVLTHMSPNFAKPGVKERAIAEIARSYDGAILCPDELATVDLST